jgi:poly(hydroxyalkanoate) depolymerase family esterase
MFDKLGPAMSRALTATRASNLEEATRQIQRALGGATEGIIDAPPVQAPLKARRGLGATLDALRTGSPLRKAHLREPVLPDGAAFLRKTQDTSHGSRDYRLYVPAKTQPRGLIVMLHGCKQNAEDFAIGTAMNVIAEAEGLLVAYPTQPHAANPSGCWNWFRPLDQSHGKGEPHIIAEMTRAVIGDYGIDSTRVFVAGLSAGGAMAAVMAAAYPELFAAAGIHSGLPYRAAHDVPSALAAMRGEGPSAAFAASTAAGPRRLIVFHGTADHTVSPSNARALMEDATRTHAGAEIMRRNFESGSREVAHLEITARDGTPQAEAWLVSGAGHHWSGGDPSGSYAKPDGPNASREMMRFFLGRRLPA